MGDEKDDMLKALINGIPLAPVPKNFNLATTVFHNPILHEIVFKSKGKVMSDEKGAEMPDRQQVPNATSLICEVTDMYNKLDRLEGFLHKRKLHPDYEYTTVTTGRKSGEDDTPPDDGKGTWEYNTFYCDRGWQRFDYTEESYFYRLKPGG